jgi:hypothetical protein
MPIAGKVAARESHSVKLKKRKKDAKTFTLGGLA